ncbi:MAG: hypothetical protein ABSG92_07335 [Conexivisphaerales archaeon]
MQRKSTATSALARMAICAALYAVVNGITAPISTPWHVGQFRPGVVIPAIFSITSGTMVGAAGAGLGSMVGDILFLVPLGQTNYLLAVAAGLPGNFVGFLLFGWIVNRYKSWSAFTVGSVVSLLVGNVIAAAGVMLLAFPSSTGNSFWMGLMGFTLFWEFTMLPFMILVVPVVLRALSTNTSSRIWSAGMVSWATESLSRIMAISVLSSIPFFVVGGLSLAGYFDSFYKSWPTLGSVLGSVMSVFELGIAVTLVLAPVAPKIASLGRRGQPLHQQA